MTAELCEKYIDIYLLNTKQFYLARLKCFEGLYSRESNSTSENDEHIWIFEFITIVEQREITADKNISKSSHQPVGIGSSVYIYWLNSRAY